MIDILVVFLLVLGVALMLLAGVGVVRMPDLYTRLQASTKAASLGAGSILVGLALQADEASVAVRALLGVLFIFLTVPVSGHMIARAAYLTGPSLWEETHIDELEGRYVPGTVSLMPPDPSVTRRPGDDALIELLAQGHSDREIGERLGLPAVVVARRVTTLLRRHGLRRRADAVRLRDAEGGTFGSPGPDHRTDRGDGTEA
jgi:multicomponent Na+:H+ antiporter subunit G